MQVMPVVSVLGRDMGEVEGLTGEKPVLQVQILVFNPPSMQSALVPQVMSQSFWSEER
jgi:hypothetical protein